MLVRVCWDEEAMEYIRLQKVGSGTGEQGGLFLPWLPCNPLPLIFVA